jgi:hypothetical protein
MAGSSTLIVGDLACADLQQRRSDLLAHPDPNRNGIDFVEIDPADHRNVTLTFLRPVPVAAYGLPATPGLAVFTGGVRVTGIQVVSATRLAPNRIRLVTDKAGDHSPYVLTLTHPDLDPPLSQVLVSFVAPCPTDVDCGVEDDCPPERHDEPLIDYLAKDFNSFRQMLLDVASARHPYFTDGNVADLAYTIIEALAYEGDRLAYFQDAISTEAYLDTARQRRSIRRHTRLVDYQLSEGRNAWAPIVFIVTAPGTVPMRTSLLTQVGAPLSPGEAPPATRIDAQWTDPTKADDFELNPALKNVAVFETSHDVQCSPRNNEIQIHTWGNDECMLAAGTTEAYLYSVGGGGAAETPLLGDGDFLVFEQVRGSNGLGLSVDADPAKRVLVRIEGTPRTTADGLYSQTLIQQVDPVSGVAQWDLQRWTTGATLPLLQVNWRRVDALPFPLCLSTRTDDGRRLRSITVGRGNISLADHGRTVREDVTPVVAGRIPVAARLPRGPLTRAMPAIDDTTDATGLPTTQRTDLTGGVQDAVPAVNVVVTTPAGADVYVSMPDLLDSTPFDLHLVAEPSEPAAGDLADTSGRAGADAILRFGDGTYGCAAVSPEPETPAVYQAVYRVGNGLAGMIGADTIAHYSTAAPGLPTITKVRNPLPAAAGEDPEPVEHARHAAPVAFAADQLRAVTEADYVAALLRLPSVQSAAARFRWTGSWLTVFTSVDPSDRADLVDLSDGHSALSAELESEVRAQLDHFRMTGYDIELRPPTFVALDIAMDICVLPGHFRSDVVADVRRRMGSRCTADGYPGFFHHSRTMFAAPVRLSAIYAEVEAVPGVDTVAVTRFRRLGQPDNGELARGVMQLGPAEIARCDNDPDFAEHGVLTTTAHGGKG